MAALGTVGIADKGNYSPTETYKKGNFVLYNDSTWVVLANEITGVTPVNDGANWKYLAKGASILTDTEGLLGTPGASVANQALIDEISDRVDTKLVPKTAISNQQVDDPNKVTGSELTYEMNQTIIGLDNSLTTLQTDLTSETETRVSEVLSIKSNYVNVLDFGAVGDGVTDDTLAFQTAIDYACDNKKIVIIPSKVNPYVLDTIYVKALVKIIGTGEFTRIKAKSGNSNLFVIRTRNCWIEMLNIDMADSVTNSSAFYLDTSYTNTIYDIHLYHIRVNNAYHAIKDANSTYTYSHLFVNDFMCYFAKSTQIELDDATGFIYLEKTSIDYSFNAESITYPALKISNVEGLILTNFDVVGRGQATSSGVGGADGIRLINCTAVWFNRVMLDYVNGKGIVCVGSNHLYFNDVVCSLCALGSIYLENCVKIYGASIVAIGAKTLSNKEANCDGIFLTNCSTFNIPNITVTEHTGNGFKFVDSSKIQIGSLASSNNDLKGILETATGALTSMSNIINMAITDVNTGGNLKLVSAYSHIINVILTSGNMVSNQVGPVEI